MLLHTMMIRWMILQLSIVALVWIEMVSSLYQGWNHHDMCFIPEIYLQVEFDFSVMALFKLLLAFLDLDSH